MLEVSAMERNAKRFEVSGKFVQKGKEKKFSMEVSAVNENDAAEKVLALFGSRNRLARPDPNSQRSSGGLTSDY